MVMERGHLARVIPPPHAVIPHPPSIIACRLRQITHPLPIMARPVSINPPPQSIKAPPLHLIAPTLPINTHPRTVGVITATCCALIQTCCTLKRPRDAFMPTSHMMIRTAGAAASPPEAPNPPHAPGEPSKCPIKQRRLPNRVTAGAENEPSRSSTGVVGVSPALTATGTVTVPGYDRDGSFSVCP